MQDQLSKPLSYRVNDFCALVGISRATFYKEVRAGELSIIKVGTRSLVKQEAVKAWLQRKEAASLSAGEKSHG